MNERTPARAEPLRGYELAHDHPPKPMEVAYLQRLRDAVDPQGPDPMVAHVCEKCTDCREAGHVVADVDVRNLLQHIDYLQRELDQIEAAAIDYFGDD